MNRAIHPDTLTFVIREVMSMKIQCRGCTGGRAELRKVDDHGCNWTVSALTGSGCGQCLVILLPVIRELKQRFPLADADSGMRTFDLRDLLTFDTGSPNKDE